jgi:glycine cleavage system H protein
MESIMKFQDDVKYTESHEWLRLEGNVATIGITDYAQSELGDVIFVDIPELKSVRKGESFGSIEAVKTVSDVLAHVSGTLTEINSALEGSPDLVNTDPFGEGWMIKMTISDPSEVDNLMDVAAYRASVGK